MTYLGCVISFIWKESAYQMNIYISLQFPKVWKIVLSKAAVMEKGVLCSTKL